MIFSIETWPCYNIHLDLGITNNGQIMCAGCSKRAIVSRFILYGQSYDANTIESIQLDNRLSFEKVFSIKFTRSLCDANFAFCFVMFPGLFVMSYMQSAM